ncbi:MAG: hypothetical protein P8M19_05550 [Crocinitomicaceae bacterium]|nr:hypothetical protein [Crocinitomicaceae bacterium]MDG1659148.1 hypothetical protein [Crocinitomicaceae bacterium]MDG2441116.1 hypothetical protein [Crocinitomicaceae bacterium]
MNDLFSSFGFGWTMSKVLPYALFLLLGIVMTLLVRRKSSNRKVRISAWLLTVVPFLIYFMGNPIYESDFANDYSIVDPADEISEMDHLTVIAIPNCPYCHEALDRLLKIQERTSSVNIDFKVLSTDSLALDQYLEKAKGRINIVLESDFVPFETISKSRFPTYVFTSSAETRIWHNDQIGTRAFDWLEGELSG